MMAAPSKLTDACQARIVQAIGAGCHREIAAEYGGVNVATFYRWMAEGDRARIGRKREFFDAVRKAEVDLEAELVARIKLASVKDWRAAVELLKRRHPERWGNTMRVTGADGGPVAVVTREQAVNDGKERARRLKAV